MSRSYINKFIFGYDISPSVLLIGTAILFVGIRFLQLRAIKAKVQPSEANLTSADKQNLPIGIFFQMVNMTFPITWLPLMYSIALCY